MGESFPMRRAVLERTAAMLVAAGAAFFVSMGALADEKEACATSYEHAQKLKREGKLKEARDELVICGGEKCPSVLVPYCVQMLHDVDETMPTVIVVARGPQGEQVDAVRVLIDGAVVAEKLDGRPIPIDPGKHHVRYELAGNTPVEEDLIVSEGERGRRLEPSFRPKGPSAGAPTSPNAVELGQKQPGTQASGPGKWPAYLMLGIGGAGLIAGGVTGGLAIAAKSSLDKECHTKSNCPASAQTDIDKLNTMGIASTVGFAAGGAAAGVGIILAIALPSNHVDKGAPKSATNVAPHIEPWASPFGAGVRGTF